MKLKKKLRFPCLILALVLASMVLVVPAQAGKVSAIGTWDCGEIPGTVSMTIYEDGTAHLSPMKPGSWATKDYYKAGDTDNVNESFNYEEPPYLPYMGGVNAIIVDNGIWRLGGGVFLGTSQVNYVDLPDSLRSIGDRVFSSVVMDELKLPEGLESIGKHAFGHSAIKKLILPASLRVLDERALSDSAPKSGQIVQVSDDNPLYRSFEGALYNKDCSVLIYYPVNSIDCHVPNGVKSIGAYAFDNNVCVESVVLPCGLLSIEKGAFVYCIRMKTIYIPDTVRFVAKFSVATDPFLYDTRLTDIYYGGTEIQWAEVHKGDLHRDLIRFNVQIPSTATSVPLVSSTEQLLFTDGPSGPSKWAVAEILEAVKAGIVPLEYQQGYSDQVSRLCAAAFVLYVFGDKLKLVDPDVVFTDTDDPIAMMAGSVGLFIGDASGAFMPNKPLTRIEFVIVCHRLITALGVDIGGCGSHPFIDIPGWAADVPFGWFSSHEIVRGTSETRFDPALTLTLEQLIVLIYRLRCALP